MIPVNLVAWADYDSVWTPRGDNQRTELNRFELHLHGETERHLKITGSLLSRRSDGGRRHAKEHEGSRLIEYVHFAWLIRWMNRFSFALVNDLQCLCARVSGAYKDDMWEGQLTNSTFKTSYSNDLDDQVHQLWKTRSFSTQLFVSFRFNDQKLIQS